MKVFLHGVPETAAIWDGVRAAIDEPTFAFSLPGFGSDRPEGFTATKDAYVEWVVQGLDAIGEPVDLVGHDWGAGLTYRIATAFPDRLRSWVADTGKAAHPDYEWHEYARTWQTPGEGEAFVQAQAAMSAEEGGPSFEAMGVPAHHAREMAGAIDQTMGDSILALYRSAMPNMHAHWGPWQPTVVPGLVIHPEHDPFSDHDMARETAELLGARFEVLEGVGHFWPYEDPEEAVALLQRFWASV